MAKTPTVKPRAARKSASQREQDAAKAVDAAGAPDPQTGMQAGRPGGKEAKGAALQEQFNAADEKAAAAIAEATLGRTVRGY